MALVPLTERQKTLIVNNVVNACKGIDNLNKTGYNFLYQASGFIAHYDLYGFIAYYKENSLKDDILRNKRANEWRNFHPKDENYAYYMSKADIYAQIVQQIA
jgi:hypothetical protein